MEHKHAFVKEATYYYTTSNGVPVYRKVKKRCECGQKTFVNQRRVGSGNTYVNGLGNVPKVPYNLGPVTDAIAEGQPIWVVEGEKDVETLRDLGEVGTCAPDGAGSWDESYAVHLYGASEVRIVADDDTPGHKYRATVRVSLAGRVDRIAWFKAAVGNDLTEHIEAGLSLADLLGDRALSAGIAKDLAPQFARAALRPNDSRLPLPDDFPTPASWARITHQPCAATRDRILSARQAHQGDLLPPHEVPVRCAGCAGFLMVETKPGAGRVCHRCRVTYKTETK